MRLRNKQTTPKIVSIIHAFITQYPGINLCKLSNTLQIQGIKTGKYTRLVKMTFLISSEPDINGDPVHFLNERLLSRILVLANSAGLPCGSSALIWISR